MIFAGVKRVFELQGISWNGLGLGFVIPDELLVSSSELPSPSVWDGVQVVGREETASSFTLLGTSQTDPIADVVESDEHVFNRES